MFYLIDGAKVRKIPIRCMAYRDFFHVNVCMSLLSLDSSYTREHLTFDGLEEGTTTGRDVRNLVGQTELVDTSYRVTTTDE